MKFLKDFGKMVTTNVSSMLIVIMIIELNNVHKDLVFFLEVSFFVELLKNHMNVSVIGCFFLLNRPNVAWGSCGRGGNS